MSKEIFTKLQNILSTNGADFKVIKHTAVGTSEEVALARKTELGQGAKALVCTVKGIKQENLPSPFKELNIKNSKITVLAVLSAKYQADLTAITNHLNAKRTSLASPNEVQILTDCVIGSIPPFSFNKELILIADPRIFNEYEYIAFNAGLLDRSIILKTKDYLKIANPIFIEFAKN